MHAYCFSSRTSRREANALGGAELPGGHSHISHSRGHSAHSGPTSGGPLRTMINTNTVASSSSSQSASRPRTIPQTLHDGDQDYDAGVGRYGSGLSNQASSRTSTDRPKPPPMVVVPDRTSDAPERDANAVPEGELGRVRTAGATSRARVGSPAATARARERMETGEEAATDDFRCPNLPTHPHGLLGNIS